ncbi:MAG: dihydroneopterin aldolase [Prevotellaceae bacterium]|jgi:dihydroneopterin aldolase|nr:dihydroneopterin aldolase [Prevotellaceae bacterium]
MGTISLEGMEFFARHGCFSEEQAIGNRFLADVHIEVNVSRAAASDSVDDTVSYQEVYKAVERQMLIPSKLLEHVAGRIANGLLHDFGAIERVTVKVAKLNPPLGGGAVRQASVCLSAEAPKNADATNSANSSW